MQVHKILPYTSVFIKLIKGPIDYTEKSTWEKLLNYEIDLIPFLAQLGLKLIVSKDDGYAYIELNNKEEDVNVSWIVRRPLTYEESIMLVLLREMMAEFETGESSSRELIKKRREIKEYAELFFKENASRVKFLKEIDRLIDKMEEYEFIDLNDNNDIADEQRFRIKKIIKAKVDSEDLDAFAAQLNIAKAKKANKTTD